MSPSNTWARQRLFDFTPKSSVVRAAMAAMNHDPISAGLWALAGFDPALVHFAELREHTRKLSEEDRLRVSLDRALSIYLEGQCYELGVAAEVNKALIDSLIDQRIGDTTETAFHVLGASSDPLMMEVFTYALYLGVLTAHGQAPWRRYAEVMADCFRHAHPAMAR